jgi:hypothetical protein
MTISPVAANPVSLLDWIQALDHCLQVTRREDGSPHTALSEDSHWDAVREDLQEIIYAAHDDELPNEWRYSTVSHIAGCLLEASLLRANEMDVEDYREISWEIATAGTDSYTSDQMEWMTANLNRLTFHEENLPAELLTDVQQQNIPAMVQLRQEEEIEFMVQIVLTGLEALAR